MVIDIYQLLHNNVAFWKTGFLLFVPLYLHLQRTAMDANSRQVMIGTKTFANFLFF
jgi:hypothetical protein